MKQYKTSLEKASKLSRAFKLELVATEELIVELQTELTRRESVKISKDIDGELNWIQVSCSLLNNFLAECIGLILDEETQTSCTD